MMLKKNSLFWFIMFILYITITNGQDVSKEASVDSTDQSMFILEQIYQEKNVICLETYLPPHNPFPSFADFHQAESRLSKSLDFFENILNQYIDSRYIKEIEKQCHKDNFSEWRKERSEVLLAWYQAVFSMVTVPSFVQFPVIVNITNVLGLVILP